MKVTVGSLFRRLPFQYAWRIALLYGIKKLLKLEPFKFYFSQLGEDIILYNLLNNKPMGFFIDVGCNDPINYNNTFNFYLQGWSGINIDANKTLVDRCKLIRPLDINLHSTIGENEEEVTFYISSGNPEVSTTDYDTYVKWKDNWNFDQIITSKTKTLTALIYKYLPPKTEIDFLTIDIEGADFKAIKTLDFNLYRPKIIVIESHDFNLNRMEDSEIYNYLKSNQYNLIGYSLVNAYFKDNQ